MEDVGALLSHCFMKKNVSSECKCLFCVTYNHAVTAHCEAEYNCVCFDGAAAFQMYLTAVMALQYSEQPDYSALKAGLSAALLKLGGSLEQPVSF